MGKRGLFVLVGMISLVILSSNIGGLDLYGFDEARNAYCAREMQQAGDWVVPTFNGNLRALKPPLHYWGMILAYEELGYGGLGARLGGVLAGVLTVLLVMAWTWRYHGKQAALLSVLVLLSSIHFSIQIHQAVPDPYLILFIALTVLSLYHYTSEGSRSGQAMSYVFLGLAILSKGPVAIALVGLCYLIFLLLSRQLRWSVIMSYRPFMGLLIALCVSVPWFLLVHHRTGGAFTEGFFLTHNLRRFSEPLEGHGGLFLLTWLYLFVGMLPFSFLLPSGIIAAWKARSRLSHPQLLAISGGLAVVLFFCLSSTKLISYTTPAYPFAAIVIALYVQMLTRKAKRSSLIIHHAAHVLLASALSISAYLLIAQDESLHSLQTESLFTLVILLGALTALVLAICQRLVASWWALGIGHVLAGMLFFYYFAPQMDELSPVRRMESLVDQEKTIVSHGLFNPAYLSLWDRPIPNQWDVPAITEYLAASTDTVYVLTQERYLDGLQDIPDLQVLSVEKDLIEAQRSAILIYAPR